MLSSQRCTQKRLKDIVTARTVTLDGFGEEERKQFAPGRVTTVTNSTFIMAGEVATTDGKQLIPIHKEGVLF